jgi:D-alanyl-D-alanine carboxypeptidase
MHRKPGRISVLTVSFLSVLLLLACAVLAGASCKQKDSGRQAPALSQETVNKLESATDSAMKETGAPGCIAGVWTPQGSWTTAKGMADTAGGVPMKAGDLMRIGSVTKSFTATTVLILCDEGKLGLEDRLSKFMPSFPRADQVTMRQLLSHTSGIPSWDEDESIRLEVQAGTGGWTVERLVEWAAGRPFSFEPGTAYQYNNLNYNLLGMIIEQVTGKPAGQVIEEKIADPLGLEHTFMPAAAQAPGETVHGYDGAAGAVQDVTGRPSTGILNYELAGTAGGMISTLEDLHVWARALATGQLLSEKMRLEQQPKPDPAAGAPFTAGYGLGLSLMDVWLGHAGAVSGYSTYMFYYPEQDAVIVTFFNKLSAFDEKANAAEQWAYGKNFVKMSKALYPDTFPDM